MISCQRQHLEARCRERGYTLDDVRGCIVSEDGDALVVDETHADYPRQRKVTVLEKATNFAAATARHVAAGLPMCSQEQIEARHAICTTCEHYADGACTKCGCPVVREKRFVSKLSWADQECPVGKWGKIDAAGGG